MPSQGNVAQIRVLAAAIRRGDAYLVCQRPPHKRHGGLWEFPGGKVEPGESDQAALARELQEELGLELTSLGAELFARSDPGSDFHIVFVAAVVTGSPVPHEHTALRWATPAEAAQLPLAPSDAAFVAHLVQGTP